MNECVCVAATCCVHASKKRISSQNSIKLRNAEKATDEQRRWNAERKQQRNTGAEMEKMHSISMLIYFCFSIYSFIFHSNSLVQWTDDRATANVALAHQQQQQLHSTTGGQTNQKQLYFLAKPRVPLPALPLCVLCECALVMILFSDFPLNTHATSLNSPLLQPVIHFSFALFTGRRSTLSLSCIASDSAKPQFQPESVLLCCVRHNSQRCMVQMHE